MTETYPAQTYYRRQRLEERRQVLIAYLSEVAKEEDWHGVQDAASDLR